MKKIIFAIAVSMLLMSGCNPLELNRAVLTNPLENELKMAEKIVFMNNKENTLRFTVADPKVISDIAGVISRSKNVQGEPGVESDYTITFHLPNGKQKVFEYWMGLSEYNKEINLKDDEGTYYSIAERLDVYIVNNTKMSLRPKYFVNLYAKCLSEAIALLEKDESGTTTVGVDVTSDRRMRRYTMSYEEEMLFNRISAEGYTILPFSEEGSFTYTLSFVTNMYNTGKVKLTVEAIKCQDQTKKTYIIDGVLENNVWIIKTPVDLNKKEES